MTKQWIWNNEKEEYELRPVHELVDAIQSAYGKKLTGTISTKDHPNCPQCGSSNTSTQTAEGECPCHGNCWSRPVCMDCGFEGWANSDGIYWHSHLQD